MPETVYENHLKGEYIVEKENFSLIITARSCYSAAIETAWLVSNLPRHGTEEIFEGSLSRFGVLEPKKILQRLINIGVLRIKQKQFSIKRAIKYAFAPDIRIISAYAQEAVLGFFKITPSEKWLKSLFPLIAIMCASFLVGAALQSFPVFKALKEMSVGSGDPVAVAILIVAGGIIHEIGHSLAAAACGMGFRPIGLSIYLFFPVFYTNVSGVEKLSFKQKAAIDCGGLIAQAIFFFALASAWAVSAEYRLLEAMKWTGLIMLFNVNPLLKTDGYWLYRDIRADIKPSKAARSAHILYLAMFWFYTMYLIYRTFIYISPVFESLFAAIENPETLLASWHKTILQIYILVLVLIGGLHRMREGKQEWIELRTRGENEKASIREPT